MRILLIYLFASFVGFAANAQEGLIKRVDQTELASERLLRALTWEKAGDNLREVVEAIHASHVTHNDVPLDRAFEYAIQRNSGWRKLHFSTWNEGWRVMTEPYARGDWGLSQCDPNHPDRKCPTGEVPATTPARFKIGGSIWLYNTQDIRDNDCGPDKLYHLYYEFEGGASHAQSGNKCTIEGPVWRRPRLFAGEPLPTE